MMPVKFEWQTDKEQEWTDEAELVGQTVSLRRHWRIWLALFLVLIVVIGIGLALLTRRVTITENRMADDVLASHRLVQQAVANRDGELFAALLFPYYRQWGETQQKMFDRQLFLDRVPLGLWAAPHLAASEPVVTIAPDLETAVIITQIPYIIEKSGTVTETIVLENTAVYQRDNSQWLLAPPPDDESFWGEWITVKGSLLELVFPERDAEVGHRLAADLDDAIVEMCRLTAVFCPPTFSLSIKLDSDYAQMTTLDEDYRLVHPRRAGANVYRLILPAPTLVGRPVDEAGYQAVMRGYAGWMTAVLVNEFDRAQQPDHNTIAQHLAQLDLQPPPLNRARPWQPQPPPPIPLPEQDIVMVCKATNQRPSIWRYDLADSTWTDETEPFAAAGEEVFVPYAQPFLLPMPDDAGFILQMSRIDNSGEYGRLFLWRDGAVLVLVEEMSPRISWLPLFFMAPTVQQGRHLFFYELLSDEPGDYRGHWLDLSSCPGPSCQLQIGSDALPYWSPDETRTLLYRIGGYEPPSLALGDGIGQETAAIGTGWSPTWLDDNAFAYARPDPRIDPADFAANSMVTELVKGVVAGTAVTEQVLLHSETLRNSLPEAERPAQLAILTAFQRPAQPGQWLIQATTSFDNTTRQDYVFSFTESGGKVALLLTLEDILGIPMQLAGNGRYLVVPTTQGYLLYDLERNQTIFYDAPQTGFSLVDWSADGQWFIIVDEAELRLVAPGSGYERPIFHGMDGCGTAVWMNR